MHSISLDISAERRQAALIGQLRHHSQNNRAVLRRLLQQQQEEAGKKEEEETISSTLSSFHPSSWRKVVRVVPSNDTSTRRGLQSNVTEQPQQDVKDKEKKEDPVITSLELSNCHLVLYSGIIALGSNQQLFRVDFDTASSDLWVMSSELCSKHDHSSSKETETTASAGTVSSASSCPPRESSSHWRLYNATKSLTSQPASENEEWNAFSVQYEDGEVVRGSHVMDTLWIGDDSLLKIEGQVFAQVTEMDYFLSCQDEEGILGLANTLTTSHHFPSLLSSFLHHPYLPNNVFGLYLAPNDDYDDDDDNNKVNNEDNEDLRNRHRLNIKKSASSQLVLGGVDQHHYIGCLTWHAMIDSADYEQRQQQQPLQEQVNTNDGTTTTTAAPARIESNYWSLPLTDVKVGGQSMTTSPSIFLTAVLDSGSSYLVGPQGMVAQIVMMNHAKCFTLLHNNANTPEQVSCDHPDGFDGALLSHCNDPFFNLEFIIDQQVYVLEKEDLLVHIETLFGEACILRMVGAKNMNGWVLGDAFLNKYYAALDFENQRIGLALAADNALDICEEDLKLDLHAFWKKRTEQQKETESFHQDPDDSLDKQEETKEEVTTAAEEDSSESPQSDDTTTAATAGMTTDAPSVQQTVPEKSPTKEPIEVFDLEDAQNQEEDFDFDNILMTEEPTAAPIQTNKVNNNTIRTPPPNHNEPPEEQPLPELPRITEAPAAVSETATTTVLPQPNNEAAATSSSSGVAIYVVVAAIVALLVAIVLRKTGRRRRQQAMFQQAWKDAEKEIVQSHRNLNYRDHDHHHHHVKQQHVAIKMMKTKNLHNNNILDDEAFYDEEEQQHEVVFVEDKEEEGKKKQQQQHYHDEDDNRNNFVLDTDMLNKMN